MQASLGRMSTSKMFNWPDRAANSVEQTVALSLEIGWRAIEMRPWLNGTGLGECLG